MSMRTDQVHIFGTFRAGPGNGGALFSEFPKAFPMHRR